MIRLLGVSGSLRRNSYNTALLRNAATLTPDGASLEVMTLHGVPLYDGDEEDANGIPEAVTALKEAIAAADGVIFSTPEYNNGVPGVLKNALDWATRPSADIARVFGGRHVAVIGASPGGFGTVLAQNHWLPVLRALRTEYWAGGRLLVSHAGAVFDKSGAMTDETARANLAAFLAGFVNAIRHAENR